MSDVYSGYFTTLCNHRRYNEALEIIDNVRGRVDAQALEHHESQHVHPATPEEQELTRLNFSLINTDDPKARAAITSAIYTSELAMPPSLIARESIRIGENNALSVRPDRGKSVELSADQARYIDYGYAVLPERTPGQIHSGLQLRMYGEHGL